MREKVRTFGSVYMFSCGVNDGIEMGSTLRIPLGGGDDGCPDAEGIDGLGSTMSIPSCGVHGGIQMQAI